MLAGFSRMIITPPQGHPIPGYFNARYREAVLDELCLKVFLVRSGNVIGGIISFDLCDIATDLYEEICSSLQAAGYFFARNLIICATHTHTGAAYRRRSGILEWRKATENYTRFLQRQTTEAVALALANLCPSTFEYGSRINNPFVYNRRYVMKDGTVVTNPGKLNPQVVGPEGAVDREVGVLLVRQKSGIVGLLVNLCNHGDTIGGSRISADWPGFMERQVQKELGFQVPVLALMGAAGNLNHFDLSSADPQTSYAEAERIGRGYGSLVCRLLPNLVKMQTSSFSVNRELFPVKKRVISQQEIRAARRIVQKFSKAKAEGELTALDLARGNPMVRFHFARIVLDFAEKENGQTVIFPLVSLRFGKELGLVSLPGEPFTELGMEIKGSSPCNKTFVVTLSNGDCGYIPMRECFARGGYETLPYPGGGVSKGTAAKLVQKALQALQKFEYA